jgi:hypothetical protein
MDETGLKRRNKLMRCSKHSKEKCQICFPERTTCDNDNSSGDFLLGVALGIINSCDDTDYSSGSCDIFSSDW